MDGYSKDVPFKAPRTASSDLVLSESRGGDWSRVDTCPSLNVVAPPSNLPRGSPHVILPPPQYYIILLVLSEFLLLLLVQMPLIY